MWHISSVYTVQKNLSWTLAMLGYGGLTESVRLSQSVMSLGNGKLANGMCIDWQFKSVRKTANMLERLVWGEVQMDFCYSMWYYLG